MRNFLIFLGVLVAIGAVAFLFFVLPRFARAPIEQACTEEAKLCPDGSSVGRAGPNCDFAECPGTATTTPEVETTVAALNQRILTDGVHLTPLEVVSDSRCPIDVQCIQAGTVSVRTRIEVGTNSETVILTLAKATTFVGKNITLTSATPAKSSKQTILPADYRFEFKVANAPTAGVGLLAGTMTIGPVCPVEQINNPCRPTPEMFAARKISVFASDRKTLITTITPGSDGTFSSSLPAGTYYLRMQSAQSGIGSVKGLPATIIIKNGTTTRITVDVDTGIR